MCELCIKKLLPALDPNHARLTLQNSLTGVFISRFLESKWLSGLVEWTKLPRLPCNLNPKCVCMHAGFRGGFIFPTFFAGTAFGHAIFRGITSIPHITPFIGGAPPILFCMTVAVGAPPLTIYHHYFAPVSTTWILSTNFHVTCCKFLGSG